MFVHNIDPVFIEIFGWPIHYYGLMYALLFLCSYFLGRWYLKRFHYNPDHADNLLLIAVIAVIVGARLGHVFFYSWPYYSQNPLEILYIWEGGLASHGATIALIIAAWVMTKVSKIKILPLSDLIVLCASLGVVFVRIGNFINGEIVGRLTEVPWGVVFPCNGLVRGQCGPELRHPVQLYEALTGIIIFIIMILILTKWRNYRSGFLSGFFLISYFGLRFILEYFKEYDGTLILPPLTNGQFLSLPAIALGIFLIIKTFKKNI